MYGIVTYHDGINFGAYLQVYALHKTLTTLGYPNRIINYKGMRFWKNEYRCFLRTRNPASLVANLVKIAKFRKAQRLFDLTSFSFSVDSFKDMHFDAIVFGSDEIWNYRNPLIGFDPAYFGEGFSASRFISYAASCGNLDIATGFTPEICRMVSRFNALSVRDENSFVIVRNATGRDAEIVLDPTFLYDFNREEIPSSLSDFIMVYTVKFDSATESAVRKYADAKGKRLISIGYMNKFCDQSIVGIGPFEFLGYLKAADEVITSMFHGTLFSIKYRKNFCIIPEAYRTNKLTTVLSKLFLRDRVLQSGRTIAGILGGKIDYARVGQIIEEESDRSLEFLKRSLAP